MRCFAGSRTHETVGSASARPRPCRGTGGGATQALRAIRAGDRPRRDTARSARAAAFAGRADAAPQARSEVSVTRCRPFGADPAGVVPSTATGVAGRLGGRRSERQPADRRGEHQASQAEATAEAVRTSSLDPPWPTPHVFSIASRFRIRRRPVPRARSRAPGHCVGAPARPCSPCRLNIT